MGVKYFHVVLILVSIILCIFFGQWTLKNDAALWAYVSFIAAAALVVYFIRFIKKMKTL